MFFFVILSGDITSKYFSGVLFVLGWFLSVMGSCDRCSRTETCTSASVTCESLDYKFQILGPETLQNKHLDNVLM